MVFFSFSIWGEWEHVFLEFKYVLLPTVPTAMVVVFEYRVLLELDCHFARWGEGAGVAFTVSVVAAVEEGEEPTKESPIYLLSNRWLMGPRNNAIQHHQPTNIARTETCTNERCGG